MIKTGKMINSALLELWLGILAVGIVCQLVGMYLAEDGLAYTGALWIGIILALLNVSHMYRSLLRALETGKDATKLVTVSGLIRYVFIIIVFIIISATKVLNPLVTIMGLLSLKAAAYLQPVTHKLCTGILGR